MRLAEGEINLPPLLLDNDMEMHRKILANYILDENSK
jgi:hypothetical protein